MSFGQLLPLLPFYYPQRMGSQNMALLNKLSEIFQGNINRAIYIIEKAFSEIFQSESFQMFYEEHQRLYNLTLTNARSLGINIDEDRKFSDIAHNMFESKTGKKVANNSAAFRMLLSLLRRKYNWENSAK